MTNIELTPSERAALIPLMNDPRFTAGAKLDAVIDALNSLRQPNPVGTLAVTEKQDRPDFLFKTENGWLRLGGISGTPATCYGTGPGTGWEYRGTPTEKNPLKYHATLPEGARIVYQPDAEG